VAASLYNEIRVLSRRFAICFGVAWVLISGGLLSCGPARRHDPAVGEAYVGPATISLHKEIHPKSPVMAVVHFGDKVELLGSRRRFVRIRTKTGAEGWIDERLLLGQAEMDQIKAQSEAARKYPSQGVATTFDAMNVHAEPNRTSPSFLQIREGEKFDVLEHRLVTVPKGSARKNLFPAAKAPAKKPRKVNRSKVPPPPAPAPPALPLDWLELSRLGEDVILPKEEEPPTTQEEDWSLVRTASGQSGWVLTRRLYMAIPDEVAQYAEGKHITSYFPLGKVHDGDRVKDIWLWTTSAGAGHPYDFDGFRVFIWSLRHHRYETALIKRRVVGYFPTLADASTGTFSVCIQNDDGHRYRREYHMVEAQVKFVGEKPCDPGTPGQDATQRQAQAPKTPEEGAFDKLKGKLKSIIK